MTRSVLTVPAVSTNDLVLLWAGALRDLVLRHPNRTSTPILELLDGDPPSLSIALDKTFDSTSDDAEMARPFRISTVKLSYWPGVRLARAWIAAAWAGYLHHEALELVTVGDLSTRPLDPHEAPFLFDRGLREGLPVDLTPETLTRALATAMPSHVAEKLVTEWAT